MTCMSGWRPQRVKLITGRCGRLLIFVLLIAGCGERQSSKQVLLEFKQQPNEKYIYRIADYVEWEIGDKDGRRYTYQHQQEQKSEMRIASIDSAAGRALTMSFVVTKDTVINAPDFAWLKQRGSIVGKRFAYQLRMRKNGEIISVVSDDPKVTFFFDRSYKPSQPVFPDRTISPGYTWTQNFPIAVPDGAPTVATTRYQFAGFAEVDQFDCAVIDFKGELEFAGTLKSSDKKSSEEFVMRKYHMQMTSEGQIFFAYREGYMIKKVNLITSTDRSTAYTKDKVENQHLTVMRDHETITLTEIHHHGGEVVRYQIQ